MKRLFIAATILSFAYAWTTPAIAQNAEDEVAEAFMEWALARNDKDAAALAGGWYKSYTLFQRGGLLSESNPTTQELTNNIRAGFEAGRDDNIQVRHLRVRVFGEAAIVTCYWTGTLKGSEGATPRTVRGSPFFGQQPPGLKVDRCH